MRSGKYVGIFYFLWLGQHGTDGPYDITVDSSVDPAGLSLAIRSTDHEGVCVCPMYYFGETTPVPLGRMYTKGIHFHAGRCHARYQPTRASCGTATASWA